MQPKTTAKDFFLYLFSFVTLYISAISLISLLFAIINKAFPDMLTNGYYYGGDLYSGGMRMAIASLIIVFPVYLVTATYLNRYLTANPDRKDLAVRKWLTYLTLFVTGLAVITDLVVLVNTFLGGEITTRFILKVIAVLVVAGAVFAYYFYDLRKAFEPNMPNRSKLLVSLASLLVLAALVTGFMQAGSPMKVRAMRFDERRINDLSSIQSYVTYNYWQQKGEVPNSIEALKDPISGFYVPNDPETGAAYTYQKTGPQSFKLCANFSLPSTDEKGSGSETIKIPSYAYPPINENWKHGKGNTCFDRTIDPELYPVRTKPTI
jgi:hypothetical protein